jgi:hypothetical protein
MGDGRFYMAAPTRCHTSTYLPGRSCATGHRRAQVLQHGAIDEAAFHQARFLLVRLAEFQLRGRVRARIGAEQLQPLPRQLQHGRIGGRCARIWRARTAAIRAGHSPERLP